MSPTPSKKRYTLRLRQALLPQTGVEALSRFASWLSELISPDSGYSAEIKTRAYLTNIRLGTSLSDLGRGTVLARPSRITLARGTSLRCNVIIMPGNGYFTMGEGSHISHNAVIAAAGGISIGSDCAISSGVVIYSVTNKRPDYGELLTQTPPLKAPVTIGNHVHIGANVSILPGVTIGDNAVIGAGAVVTRSVTPNTVVAGVPARRIEKKDNS